MPGNYCCFITVGEKKIIQQYIKSHGVSYVSNKSAINDLLDNEKFDKNEVK